MGDVLSIWQHYTNDGSCGESSLLNGLIKDLLVGRLFFRADYPDSRYNANSMSYAMENEVSS
mgnify:CR=1 FL=1